MFDFTWVCIHFPRGSQVQTRIAKEFLILFPFGLPPFSGEPFAGGGPICNFVESIKALMAFEFFFGSKIKKLQPFPKNGGLLFDDKTKSFIFKTI